MKKQGVNMVAVFLTAAIVLLNIILVSSISDNSKEAEIYVAPEVQVPVETVSPTVVSPVDVPEEPVELIEYDIEYPYFITVDKVGQVVTVYTTNEEGKYETIVHQMICSTGESIDKLPDGYYPLKDSKHRWNTMLSHGAPLYAQYTTRITGSFLFHSVPYTATKTNKLDMKRYKNLGKANSGGCIRLTVEAAKWIYDNCVPGTTVYVFKGEYDAELIERLRPPEPKDGWDPTDPDPKNPIYQPQFTYEEAQPYKYAPLYDYNWEYAPEQDRIFYTTTKKAQETTASAAETTAAPTTAAPTTAATTAAAPAESSAA